MEKDLVGLIADLKENEALALVKEMLDAGADADAILDYARKAMDIVGNRFERGEYFIPDLVMAGEILKGISDMIIPHLQKTKESERQGKVLIGTVAGDIHDIGKNIVTFMLDVGRFEVIDLGVDVSVDLFVEKACEFRPQVVGLSGFLTLAFQSMKKTVEALKQAGLRDQVKIMIGGGQIDEEVRRFVQADAYGKDAVTAVSLCRQWIGE